MVYAPAHPRFAHRPDLVEYEIRQTVAGRRVLPVFTRRRGLVRMLGPAQPWVQLPLASVTEVMTAVGIGVVIDPDLAVDLRTWDEESLAQLAARDAGARQELAGVR